MFRLSIGNSELYFRILVHIYIRSNVHFSVYLQNQRNPADLRSSGTSTFKDTQRGKKLEDTKEIENGNGTSVKEQKWEREVEVTVAFKIFIKISLSI